MKKHFFGTSAVAAAALLITACASDPTDSLRGTATRIVTSLSFMELRVGDSLQVTAQTRDAQGNALASLPGVASADAGVASVSVDEELSGNPVPETVFFVKAEGFGQTTVTASEATAPESATITVVTFPASVGVTAAGGITTISSGSSVQLTGTPLASDGVTPVTGPTVTWSAQNSSILDVDDTGLATAAAPGLGVIEAESEGGAEGQISLEVQPGPFDGGITAAAGFGEQIVITPGAVAFDGDEAIVIGGLTGVPPSWIVESNTTNIIFLVDNFGASTQTVTITNVGANQLAYAANFDVTSGFAVNATPGSGPDITAGLPFSDFIELSDANPNQFYTFAPGADTDITVELEWQETAIDADIIVCTDVTCASAAGVAFTLNNPESVSVTVPGGAAYEIWLNTYDMHGAPPSIAEVRVTSP